MKDMKIASKIVLVLLSILWAAGLFFLIVYLSRETNWAYTVGEWVTNCWNNVFGTSKSTAGFFNKLGDVLVFYGIVLSIFTLGFVILCVKITDADSDEEMLANTQKSRKVIKQEETEMKKKKVEQPVEKKEKKSIFKKTKEVAKKTEEAADAAEVLAKETTASADDFLAKLRKGK